MNILVDNKNLITSFATSGSFDGGIEIEESLLPSTFEAEFKNGKFIYENGIVSYNRDFVDGEANEQLKNENVSLEDKVKTLEIEVAELKNIIANNQVPE